MVKKIFIKSVDIVTAVLLGIQMIGLIYLLKTFHWSVEDDIFMTWALCYVPGIIGVILSFLISFDAMFIYSYIMVGVGIVMILLNFVIVILKLKESLVEKKPLKGMVKYMLIMNIVFMVLKVIDFYCLRSMLNDI